MKGNARPWLWATGLYLALTLLYAWPLLPVLNTALPHDIGDPGLNAWIIWWNAHAVPLTERWWNAPIFHPIHGAFALSETLLGLAPVTTPLQWLGGSAVLAYNISFLLSFPAAALAAHALTHQLTGRHDAGVIAGLALAFNPYRAGQMPHIQMMWPCWLALGLFALHRYLARRRTRDLVLAGVCWLLNGLTSGYLLVFFVVLVALWAVWFIRSRRDWIAIGVTLAVSSIPFVPLLIGYRRYQAALGLTRNPGEIDFFSADLTAIWAGVPEAWLSGHWVTEPRPEGGFYPGVILMALILVGVVVVWRRAATAPWHPIQRWVGIAGLALTVVTLISWIAGGWQIGILGAEISLTRPLKALFLSVCVLIVVGLFDRRVADAWRARSPFLFYVAAALIMLLFALGPTARLSSVPFLYQAPYSWLMKLPGGHSLRVPARFGMLFIVCLVPAAALAFSRLTPRGPSRRAAGLLSLAILLDGWVPKLPVSAVPPPVDWAGIDRGAPLLDLPADDGYSDMAAMIRATRHAHPLINGFSGYYPRHYTPLADGLRNFDPGVISALQSFGPFLVFVQSDLDRENKIRDFMDGVAGAVRFLKLPTGTMYRVAVKPPVRSVGDRQLPVDYIETKLGEILGPEMIDGQLSTRWQTSKNQIPGDEIVVTLRESATITRVELDLGEYKDDYPRKLRVSVGDPNTPPRAVWEGGGAGLALLGQLRDLRRIPLTIDLPEGTIGKQLTLTVVSGHPDLAWSIAELRVFGR